MKEASLYDKSIYQNKMTAAERNPDVTIQFDLLLNPLTHVTVGPILRLFKEINSVFRVLAYKTVGTRQTTHLGN